MDEITQAVQKAVSETLKKNTLPALVNEAINDIIESQINDRLPEIIERTVEYLQSAVLDDPRTFALVKKACGAGVAEAIGRVVKEKLLVVLQGEVQKP